MKGRILAASGLLVGVFHSSAQEPSKPPAQIVASVSAPAGTVTGNAESAEPPAGIPAATNRHAPLLAAVRLIFPDGTVLRGNADGVIVKHAKGIDLIRWVDLPPEIATTYGYSPTGPKPATTPHPGWDGEEPGGPKPPDGTKGGSWSTPKPGYPFQARKMRITGCGVCHVTTDASGRVISARMSPGIHPLIDSTVESFAKTAWKGPPSTSKGVPITFQLSD